MEVESHIVGGHKFKRMQGNNCAREAFIELSTKRVHFRTRKHTVPNLLNCSKFNIVSQ